MDVELELALEERRDDRVLVSLFLSPSGCDAAPVDGAAVQLLDAAGEELAPRHLLPISGRVSGMMAMSVELRCLPCLPQGARIVATAWHGTEQVQTAIPADPYVRLRDYGWGSRVGLPADDEVVLRVPTPEERAALEARMPWIGQVVRPSPEVVGVIEAVEPPPTADDLSRDFHLDAETASWLEGLLDEPEPT